MDSNTANRIRNHLEKLYDIPFEVEQSFHYTDSMFCIKPQNADKELFEVILKFKNQLRMIIEVKPEKYAAFSIADMAAAPIEKKKMFAEYARYLSDRRAKIEFQINDIPYFINNPEAWPLEWKSYRLRVSRSPICSENETLNEAETASSWAAIVVGMFLSLLHITEEKDEYMEGGLSRVEVNKYERNPINRELCLAENGYSCKICGFNFEEIYGEMGHNYIHVHHIVPVSSIKEEYLINPTTDLIPVCPNCHAMIHSKYPPYLPEEICAVLKVN